MQKGKRGAVELSITTIVVVVMGITILTLGLKWITDTMGGIQDQTDNLQRITEGQIVEIFEDTEKSISTVSKTYSVKSGKTLTNLEVYLRNNVYPGDTYTFTYTFNALSHPTSVQANEVLSRLSWVQAPIEIPSGEAYSDTVLFDTKGLPVGIYKFEVELLCTGGCNPSDAKHQFIVTIN
jgi:hypothetical protein